MSCPASPEGGYHRFALAKQSDGPVDYTTTCMYCEATRTIRPTENLGSRWGTSVLSPARGAAKAHAAKQGTAAER